MVSSSQIREQVDKYLSGEMPLERFEDWLVQETWNVHRSGSHAAEVLTFAIEEALSEFSSDHIPEERLREELASLLLSDNKVVSIADAPRVVVELQSAPPLRVSLAVS